MQPKYYTAQEAKEYLRYKNIGSIWNLVSAGKLQAFKPKNLRRLYFTQEQLDAFITGKEGGNNVAE